MNSTIKLRWLPRTPGRVDAREERMDYKTAKRNAEVAGTAARRQFRTNVMMAAGGFVIALILVGIVVFRNGLF
jgi:hypothetical protein